MRSTHTDILLARYELRSCSPDESRLARRGISRVGPYLDVQDTDRWGVLQVKFWTMVARPLHGRGLWHRYESLLQRHPIRTQVITTGLLWAAGDIIAQRAEAMSGKHRGQGSAHLNRRRVALTAAYGAAIIGPLGHHYYIRLDRMVSRCLTPGTFAFVGAKVAADAFVWTPVNVAMFFALMTKAVDGGSWADVRRKLSRDFLPTLGAETVIWPGYQAVNFSRVPVHHQLLMCNVGTLFDASFLCWARDHDDWVKGVLPGLRSPSVHAPITTAVETVGDAFGGVSHLAG